MLLHIYIETFTINSEWNKSKIQTPANKTNKVDWLSLRLIEQNGGVQRVEKMTDFRFP